MKGAEIRRRCNLRLELGEGETLEKFGGSSEVGDRTIVRRVSRVQARFFEQQGNLADL